MLQCALGIYAVFIPDMLKKRFDFGFPTSMYALYLLFLYCAIFLGEVESYYANFPIWDDILHGFSGVMSALFGFMLFAVVMKRNNGTTSVSPLFSL